MFKFKAEDLSKFFSQFKLFISSDYKSKRVCLLIKILQKNPISFLINCVFCTITRSKNLPYRFIIITHYFLDRENLLSIFELNSSSILLVFRRLKNLSFTNSNYAWTLKQLLLINFWSVYFRQFFRAVGQFGDTRKIGFVKWTDKEY